LDFHPEAPDISIIDFFIYLNNQFKELSIKKILELMGCYIYNKIPHFGNKNLIPDKLFEDKKKKKKKKISIKHLRTFG